MTQKVGNWSAETRLQFIEFRLYWEGKINRQDLIEQFRISVPQCTLDLKRYLDLAPENVYYDRKRKAYLATEEFSPKLITPSSGDYLAQLEVLQAEHASSLSHESFISSPPDFDVVPVPERRIDPSLLRQLLRIIGEGMAVSILYQSLSRDEPSHRWITPHAMASDGYRWHLRSYCHERQKFIDFVFGRILEIGGTRESGIDGSSDTDWHTYLELTIAPNPSLPPAHKRVIELDYGMNNGIAKIQVRKALSSYLKKRLGFISDLSRPGESTDELPHVQQIVLLDEREIAPGF
ncbi:WYL domain-containing protein [Hydrocarboniclastica marina]|nr:WYL domain-containing protein [Hydrocarboniclastica marina]